MTREEAKELLPTIQAFVAGKQIQDAIEGLTDWVDTDEINLEYEGKKIKHRIKPEPKYRPFKTQEECWQEMLKRQPFGLVKDKDGQYIHIVSVREEKSFNYWFNNFTFTDGAPFGVMEE